MSIESPIPTDANAVDRAVMRAERLRLSDALLAAHEQLAEAEGNAVRATVEDLRSRLANPDDPARNFAAIALDALAVVYPEAAQ